MIARMSRTTLGALALAVSLTSIAHADAIPGDDACHRWEHWEGAHSGRCAFGTRCSVSPALGTGQDATLALVATGALAITIRRRVRE